VNSLARHPFNNDFTWRSSSLSGRAASTEQAQQFAEEGFFLLEGAFGADTVSQIIEEIDPLEHEAEEFLRSQPDGRVSISKADAITFSRHLVKRSPVLRTLTAADPLVGLCHDLIGPDVRLYWDQAVYKKPGNPDEFPFHQDNGYTYLEPQQYLTCWIALTDTDENNGCPWVVPGLHTSGTLAHEQTPLGWRCFTSSPAAVPVPAAAGDVVVFSSLTPHRTGPNLTDDTRKSYIVQYAPEGARQRTADESSLVPQDDPERQYVVLQGGDPVRST
jgi:phytanoyl-CoA hydroxylase